MKITKMTMFYDPNSLQHYYFLNTLLLLPCLGKNMLSIAFAANNDVPVKKEMLSPVKTCSFDEQIKGDFSFVGRYLKAVCWLTQPVHRLSQLSIEQLFTVINQHLMTYLLFLSVVLDDALMPSVLPLVKREDITPMEVSSNLQSNVFKVMFWFFTAIKIFNSNILFRCGRRSWYYNSVHV